MIGIKFNTIRVTLFSGVCDIITPQWIYQHTLSIKKYVKKNKTSTKTLISHAKQTYKQY